MTAFSYSIYSWHSWPIADRMNSTRAPADRIGSTPLDPARLTGVGGRSSWRFVINTTICMHSSGKNLYLEDSLWGELCVHCTYLSFQSALGGAPYNEFAMNPAISPSEHFWKEASCKRGLVHQLSAWTHKWQAPQQFKKQLTWLQGNVFHKKAESLDKWTRNARLIFPLL